MSLSCSGLPYISMWHNPLITSFSSCMLNSIVIHYFIKQLNRTLFLHSMCCILNSIHTDLKQLFTCVCSLNVYTLSPFYPKWHNAAVNLVLLVCALSSWNGWSDHCIPEPPWFVYNRWQRFRVNRFLFYIKHVLHIKYTFQGITYISTCTASSIT